MYNNIFWVLFFCIQTSFSVFSQNRNENWATKIETTSLENLWKINDSLYRSEQPNRKEFKELSLLGIKGILDLRENNSDLDKIDHLDLCVVNVELNASLFTDNEIVAALKALFYLPKPLLIHCKHGADRTGLIVAIYRICFQNWSKENAINELINGNFNFHVKYVNIIEYINTMDSENIKKQVLAN